MHGLAFALRDLLTSERYSGGTLYDYLLRMHGGGGRSASIRSTASQSSLSRKVNLNTYSRSLTLYLTVNEICLQTLTPLNRSDL